MGRGAELQSASKSWISSWKNATVRYSGGVLLLLILGMLGLLLGEAGLSQGSAPYVLMHGLSEAAVITALLAVLVDPHLKRRIQNESGWDAVFGYLNPKAPGELREALQELALCHQYYMRSAWSVEFAWQDDAKTVLAVTIEVLQTGINLERGQYKPNSKPWVLASREGFQSQYRRYALTCPGQILPLDARGDALTKCVSTQKDRSIYVDEACLVGNRAIPSGETFENIKEARMFRHATDFVPLHHSKFIEKLFVTIQGTALSDLDITVSHPRHEGRRLPAEWKWIADDRRSSNTHQFGRATPGQVTLLSWSPARRSPKLQT